MNCVHGHVVGCACGDCQVARCGTSSYAVVAALCEPRSRALIACQAQSGPRMVWEDRTYEVVRAADGQWLLGFDDGPPVSRRDWDAVLDWLRRMRPRDVELLEVP